MPRDYSTYNDQANLLNEALIPFFERHADLEPELERYLIFQTSFSSSKPTITVPKTAIEVAKRSAYGASYSAIKNALRMDYPNSTLLSTKKAVLRAIKCIMFLHGTPASELGLSSEDMMIIERFINFPKILEAPEKFLYLKRLLEDNPHYNYLLTRLASGAHPKAILETVGEKQIHNEKVTTMTQNLSTAFLSAYGRGVYKKRNGRELARALVFTHYIKRQTTWHGQEVPALPFLIRVAQKDERIMAVDDYYRDLYDLLRNLKRFDELTGMRKTNKDVSPVEYLKLFQDKPFTLPYTLRILLLNDAAFEPLTPLATPLANALGVKPSTVHVQLSAGVRFLENLLLTKSSAPNLATAYAKDREDEIEKITRGVTTYIAFNKGNVPEG